MGFETIWYSRQDKKGVETIWYSSRAVKNGFRDNLVFQPGSIKWDSKQFGISGSIKIQILLVSKHSIVVDIKFETEQLHEIKKC